MHIPPASFRVTPYGDVDTKVLDSLRASYDTAQLLNLVDRLDACLAEIGGVGSIREDFLRLHGMAMTVLEGFPSLWLPVMSTVFGRRRWPFKRIFLLYVHACRRVLNTLLLWQRLLLTIRTRLFVQMGCRQTEYNGGAE